MTPNLLRAGDVLLYKGTGFYSWLIGVKTWHLDVSHVEVSLGGGLSVASRDGQGVEMYKHRTQGLAYVLRPIVPFDLPAALSWFAVNAQGLPYGWLDLLCFVGLRVNAPGMVCSPFATHFLREGGVHVFNAEPAEAIAPFQFLTTELLMTVWSAKRGMAAEVV